MSGGAVKLTEVGSEAEAAMLCGYLESLGIHATYDKGGVTAGVLGSYSGPNVGRQEILVEADDLAAARDALATMDRTDTAR